MNGQALRFRIGLFVVASLILLVVMFWLFGRMPTFLAPVHRYTIIFDDATGLAPGSPVRRSGVRIGEVAKVELDDETGKVHVEVEIARKHSIRTNEQPVLRRTLLGDTSIDFVAVPADRSESLPGPAEEAMHFVALQAPPKPAPPGIVPPGSTLKGVQQTDVPASLSELQKAAESFNRLAPRLDKAIGELGVAAGNWGRVGERLEVLMKTGLEDKVMKSLDNATKTMERVAAFLSPENERNLTGVLKNVKTASDNLDSLTRSTDQFIRESQLTLKQMNNTLKQADAMMVNLEKASKPLADRGESMTKNLDESIGRLNRVLASVEDLFRDFGKGKGTLPQLLNDPQLYNNLNDAALAIVRMMPQLDRILKDVETFADKIARHPEALGVGGAIRPGSGLK